MPERTPPRTERELDAVFRALAHGTRRKILKTLARGDRRVSDLARPHAISRPAVSKHVRILEEAGLVTRLRQGSEHIIQLRTPALERAARWIAFYQRFWSPQMDALERLLSKDRRRG